MALRPTKEAINALRAIATPAVAGEAKVVLPNNFGVMTAGIDNTVDIPRTYAYKKIIANTELTVADMKTKLDTIRLRINAVDIINVNVKRYLNDLEAEGYVLTDGQLPIVFSLLVNGRSTGDEDMLTLGTLGLDSFQIIIKPVAGAVNISFQDVEAEVLPNRKPFAIMKITEHTFATLAVGSNKKTISMDEADGHLVNIRLHDVGSEITELSMKYEGVEVLDRTTPAGLDDKRQNQVIPKPAVTDVRTIDFMASSRPGGILQANGGQASIDIVLGAGALQTSMTYTVKRLIAL